MKLSTILTTHDWKRLPYLLEAIEELRTYETIVVLDDPKMAEVVKQMTDAYVAVDPAIDCLSAARNFGAELANGDVYAFIDDDVVVSESWDEELRRMYRRGALAAGGPAEPIWPNTRPLWLSKDWDWLIGCGPYHDEPCVVRNTYGCNISFKADVFDELDGFDTAYGMRNDLTQGEETELCIRLSTAFDAGVEYHPLANVYHRVDERQLSTSYLLRRAYEQGKTKARLGVDSEETGFLRTALRGMRRSPRTGLLLTAVGMGFIRG